MPVVAMYDASYTQYTTDANGITAMRPGALTSVFFFAQDQSKPNGTGRVNLDGGRGYDDKGSFFDGPQGNVNMCQNWCAGGGSFTPGLTMTPGEGFCSYPESEQNKMDTFHWQFQPYATIQCAHTQDVVCGASSTLPVLAENQCPSGPIEAYGPPCTFPVAGTSQLADAQCCYSSMADGLVNAHVPIPSPSPSPSDQTARIFLGVSLALCFVAAVCAFVWAWRRSEQKILALQKSHGKLELQPLG